MIKEQAGNIGHMRHVHQWLESNPNAWDCSDLPPGHDDGGLATKLYGACLEMLQSLCQSSQAQKTLQGHTHVLREELGKLFLWGESLRSGELDKALAFAEGLQEIVLKKFTEIGRLLLGFTSDDLRAYDGLKTLLQQAKLKIVQRRIEDDEGSDDSSSDYSSDEESRTKTHDFWQIVQRLRIQTSHLACLGPSIQRSLARLEKDELRSNSIYPPVVPFEVSNAAGVYVSLIRDKFKDASNDLVERLGEANWQRHQNVRNFPVVSDGAISHQSKPAEPTSTAIFRPVSTFHDSGMGTSVPNESHYASSHTSFLSSNTNEGLEDLRVPVTPMEVQQGKPFECFLCKRILTNIRNRVDWKIHVFADLRPYICTFRGCRAELTQYSSRNEWGEHEFEHHRVTCVWKCADCPVTCSNLTDYESHTKSSHERQLATMSWPIAANWALDKKENPAEYEQCPLCGSTPGGSRRMFINHVARHMEQIALLALPRAMEDSDDENERDGSEGLADAISTSDRQKSPPGRCNSCNRAETAKWRRGPDGPKTLCNACGLHYAKLTRKMGKQANLIYNHSQREEKDESILGREGLRSASISEASNANANSQDVITIRGLNDCTVCGNSFSNLDDLEAHMDVHKYRSQDIHGEPAISSTKLVEQSRQSPEAHECRVCGKLFKRAHNWRSHMETHHPERRFPHPCTAMVDNQPCTKKFQRKSDLDRHYDSVHLKARIHRCDLCGNRFALRDTLRRHREDGCHKRFVPGFHEENRASPAEWSSTDFPAQHPPSVQPARAPQTSSYWSMPEQQDFYNLIRLFGTNWPAIAARMNTKTDIMIENFYSRKIKEGTQGQELEQVAQQADARIRNNEDMGPLPAPFSSIKKYAENLAKREYRSPAPSMWSSLDMAIAPPSSPFVDLPKLQSEVPEAKRCSQLPDSTFACTQDDCGFSAKRKSDVRRHYKTRHSSNPPEFPCPVLRCKYSGSTGFTRKDKLTIHYKKAHQGKLDLGRGQPLRDLQADSKESAIEESAPNSPAIPAHLYSGTARTRGMRGAAVATVPDSGSGYKPDSSIAGSSKSGIAGPPSLK